MDQDYFKRGQEINLNISKENETIVDKTVTVPEKPKIVISNLDLVPNQYINGRGFLINEVVGLDITVKSSPYKYFRLSLYEKDRRTGKWVKSPTALQKQDEAFFNNTIKDVEPTNNNPIKRYTSASFHNWIYANQSDTEDEIILTLIFGIRI